MKPDYIPKDEILKELQEIENNLNELEKRGVELEVKLRSSEEGQINTHTHTHEPPLQEVEKGRFRGFCVDVCNWDY